MNEKALKLKAIQFAADEFFGKDDQGKSILHEIVKATAHFLVPGEDELTTNRLIFNHMEALHRDKLTDDEIIFGVELAKLILKEQAQ